MESSLLYWAVYKNKVEIVKELLEWGADPNTKDLNGRSPLEVGSYFWFFTVCELLLEHGARVNDDSLNRAKHGWNYNSQNRIIELLQEWKKTGTGKIRFYWEDVQ